MEFSIRTSQSLKILIFCIFIIDACCQNNKTTYKHKTTIYFCSVSVEELEEDSAIIEVGAQLVFNAHSQLLGKGFALSRPPTIMQALEGSLPFCWQSNERSFLKDFVSCSMGTSGGRLAR